MSKFYNINNRSEIREIDNDTITSWEINNNPKRNNWILVPDKPTETSVWDNGRWIEPQVGIPQTISARQIRMWLVSHGISLSAIESAIDQIEDVQQRELVRVEWEYAPYIERNHPMLVPISNSLGFTEEQIDQAFIEASAL